MTSLWNVAEIVMGQSPPGKSCNTLGDGVPLLNGPSEYGQYHPTPVQFTTDAKKLAERGDLLFCVRGSTTGRMNWADQTYAIGRGVAAIRHKEYSALQPFVRAVIESQLPNLLVQATGSTFPNVSSKQLANLMWPDIPLEHQLNSSKFLGALEGKIELNRKINRTLEEMARALFYAWFVDFEPVHANREGLPSTSVSPEIAKLFPSEFENEIPQGWRLGTLSEIAFNCRQNVNPQEMKSDEPYVGLEHIPRQSIALTEWGVAKKATSTKSKFQAKDILFGKLRPYFHKVVIAPIDGICSTDVLVVRPTKKHYFGQTLFEFSSSELIRYATQLSNGAKMPRTKWSDLACFETVIPTAEISKYFTKLASRISDLIENNIKESQVLTACRNTLLPRLISGKLPIRSRNS